MNVKLNRKQELKLIELGLQRLLDSMKIQVKSFKKANWSPARRKKFAQTMTRKFGAKK